MSQKSTTTKQDQAQPKNAAGPTEAELKAVVREVVRQHGARGSDDPTAGVRGEDLHPPDSGSDGSSLTPDAANILGTLAGELARRGIEDAYQRELVFRELQRIARLKAKDATFEQLAAMLKDPNRQAKVKGFVFEAADKHGLDCLNWASRGRTHVLQLFDEHNRKALDGVYREGVKVTRKQLGSQAAKTATKKVGKTAAGKATSKTTGTVVKKGAKFAQHKATRNPEYMKCAPRKLADMPKLRDATEVVVPRGEGKVAKKALKGAMKHRESGTSLRQVEKMTKKAANPKKASHVGKAGAAKVTKKMVGGAAVTSVGFSLASDTKGLIAGEKSKGEVAENAAWAGAEGAVSAVGAVGLGVATAPVAAAATTALAASSVAGTTALATALAAATGPVGLTLAAGWGAGLAVRKLRKATRGDAKGKKK